MVEIQEKTKIAYSWYSTLALCIQLKVKRAILNFRDPEFPGNLLSRENCHPPAFSTQLSGFYQSGHGLVFFTEILPIA